jgi:hypothetical protein
LVRVPGGEPVKQHHEPRTIDCLPCKLVTPEPPKEGPEGQAVQCVRMEHRFSRSGMVMIANVTPGVAIWSSENSVVFAYMNGGDTGVGLAEYAFRRGEWCWSWLTWAETHDAAARADGGAN